MDDKPHTSHKQPRAPHTPLVTPEHAQALSHTESLLEAPLEHPSKPQPQKKIESSFLNVTPKHIRTFLRRAGLALQKHYSEPLAYQFHTMRNGFIYFAVGLMSVLMANANMTPSLTQELVVLAGLFLTAIGFIIAIKAYVRFVISRIVIFFSKK